MLERSRQAIQTALNVLCAISESRPCDAADEVELRRVAGDLHKPGLLLDELACLVIQRERQVPMSSQRRLAPIAGQQLRAGAADRHV